MTTVVSSDVVADRYRAFGEEMDALKKRTFAEVGAEDVARVKKLDRFSRAMEIVGRVLIHVSPEPITFGLGVVALWLHKQLQATEIGHTALHGAYDDLPGAEKYQSKTFKWDVPIDEESWLSGHNVKHHGNTNVAGRDPDIDFGTVRLTNETRHAAHHRWQLPMTLLLIMPNFAFFMNPHFTGLNEVLLPSREKDAPPDRSKERVRLAWKKTLRKYVPYYLKNYVFFPALAGPMFWKVLLGNFLAETMRDIYSSATIFCGHVGPETKSYPPGARAKSRGQWYAMQIEATNNFEVSKPLSILCGGLDRQIEHHLFPSLPPERLRAVAPEVRAICEKHGIEYRTDTWGRTLKKALAHIAALSKEGGARAVMQEMA